MLAVIVLALFAGVCGKIVGLHEGASEKFKEHMLYKIVASRVEASHARQRAKPIPSPSQFSTCAQVLEGLEVNREHTSGPSSLHVIEPGSPLDKHIPVIELITGSRGCVSAYSTKLARLVLLDLGPACL